MANQFASGKNSIAHCDVCGFRTKLKDLKQLVVKAKNINVLACRECWNPDHPQLMLGMYPINDPQAVRNPRPDTSYTQSGQLADGNPGEGSRIIQWGWNPVGGALGPDSGLTPNSLLLAVSVGDVTVVTQ